ncbi:MAG TPA: phosphatidylglycerol lysyltransferase domain-containing protein [Edaphocola sp.]|nr:phosphatidylglycerol lysyltransferase domain-containing protein [Edaphocola sp.]
MTTVHQTWKRLVAGKFYWKELLSVLFLLVAFFFFRKEQKELRQVGDILGSLNVAWLIYGLLLALVYIVLQGLMYVSSFAAVGGKIPFIHAVELYLKRNLIGVFLPAGGVTSQAFFKSIPEKQGISHTKTNFASFIFVIAGIISLLIVGIPVIFYLVFQKGIVGQEDWYFLALAGILSLICWVAVSFYKRRWWYQKLQKFMPQLEVISNDVRQEKIALKPIMVTLFFSIATELIGILQVYIAMRALSPEISLPAAFLGYTIATVFLMISPFLKGAGAVELSLVYILTLYHYNTAIATSVTFLYRFFNFWFVLIAGLFSFLLNRQNLFLRIFPSLLIFTLGIVNLLSGLSPAIHWRMHLIEKYIPIDMVHDSNDFVVAAGLALIVISAFLLRGLRSAWIMALVISVLSVGAHITKAIDYEEAIFAAIICIILIVTRKQYRIKSQKNLVQTGIKIAVGVWLTGIVFGIVGFYFMTKKNFGINLTLLESAKATLQNFILLSTDLTPQTKLAKGFIRVLNVMGIGSLAFLAYTVLKPFVYRNEEEAAIIDRAKKWVIAFGNSAVDYFKTYPDKFIYTTTNIEGFISYKVANDFAIVLGTPVCADQIRAAQLIRSFESEMNNNGLKQAYYRVDKEYLPFFQSLGKRYLPIGQEAIVDIATFSMEGKSRQNLRTARNQLSKKGYQCKICAPPVPGNIIQQLKAVSDNWLIKTNRKEMVFSQGMFMEEEIKKHTVIYLESPDKSIIAFLDIIPSFKPGEARYDLIRKSDKAENGSIEYLTVALIDYCKSKGYQWLNMGMAPMSGIDMPKNFRERSIKFAYEKIKRFQHYKGLRFAKEKFDPSWDNKYLIYDHHFDLLVLPGALNKVMSEF